MNPTKALRWLLPAAMGLALCTAPQASAQATPCADLSITGVDVSPSQPIAGSAATISITVRNGGTCAAPGFVVQYKQSASALTGPSKSVSPLAAGASTTVVVSSTFTYPSAGNFQSQARVDTGNAVRETNENNNLEIKSVTVVPATRNLVIDDFHVSPQPVVQGETATATIRVCNTGNSPSGAYRLNWTPYAGAIAISLQRPSLGAGDCVVVDRDYTYTFARAVVSTARVDATNTVAETDETDNTATLNYTVEPNRADLEITNVSTSPADAVAGSVTTTTITVANTGNNPAGPFIVQWRPFAFAQPLVWQVNGLDDGDSIDVTFDYTFNAAGTFDGTARVDATNTVPEVDENNNTADTHVTVAGGQIDLELTNLCIGPASGSSCSSANPVQGEEQTAYVTVRNNGNFPSGSFVVQWNPDTTGLIPGGPHTVSQQTDSLDPGETRVVELNYTYPRAGTCTASASGCFHTLATVDAFNAVAETNETNNQRIYDPVVDPAPIDLVIDSFDVSPASPVRGVPATFTAVVRNDGPLATGRFNVQFKPRTGGIAQNQSINGLNPGEARTLTFTTTYAVKGSYTASLVVDSGNTVVEPEPGAEANNTQNLALTVVPQQTTLEVTLKSLSVIHDGDNVGAGEWNPTAFAVYDPSSHCVGEILGTPIDIPSIQCAIDSFDVDDDDVLNLNWKITVTLEEQTPLLFAVGAIDEDLPVGVQSRGYAFKLELPSAYRIEGDRDLTGQDCRTDPNPCFTAKVNVHLVSTNVPAASALTALTAAKAADRIAAKAPTARAAKVSTEGVKPLSKQAAPVKRANKRVMKVFTRKYAANRR